MCSYESNSFVEKDRTQPNILKLKAGGGNKNPSRVSSLLPATPSVHSASSGLGPWRCGEPRSLADGRFSVLCLVFFQCLFGDVEAMAMP
jgi:hypothetical protein